MPNLPTKIVAEYYHPPKHAAERKQLVYKYVITDFKSLDEALRRAKERAQLDGKRVISANFRAGEGGQIEAIVCYFEPEKKA